MTADFKDKTGFEGYSTVQLLCLKRKWIEAYDYAEIHDEMRRLDLEISRRRGKTQRVDNLLPPIKL